MSYPERIVPSETSPGIVALHLARYVFAERWSSDRDVLDLGCGTGYGAFHLSRTARAVVGGDVSEDAIGYAQSHYGAPNLEFSTLDALQLPFEDACFDTVFSFETIEHVSAPERVVEEVGRVLRPGGTFVVSTPHAAETTYSPANPFHHVEFSRDDFASLLQRSFRSVEMYGERRRQTRSHRLLQRMDVLGLRRRSTLVRRASALTGTPAMENTGLDDVIISRDDIEMAHVLIAVCAP